MQRERHVGLHQRIYLGLSERAGRASAAENQRGFSLLRRSAAASMHRHSQQPASDRLRHFYHRSELHRLNGEAAGHRARNSRVSDSDRREPAISLHRHRPIERNVSFPFCFCSCFCGCVSGAALLGGFLQRAQHANRNRDAGLKPGRHEINGDAIDIALIILVGVTKSALICTTPLPVIHSRRKSKCTI